MAKGGRKKRENRKDFQKVKLKVGKRKPKADNFTDTTFKSRSIQIREQLKSADSSKEEPVTQRKQNIQELMCQLNHYNSSVRSNAINGVKSLVVSHPTLLNEHLSSLISNLCVVLTDKEPTVRQAGSALLQVVMDSVPAKQMSPFFSVVCMHLCCAMTHIQEDIQLDSLVVMDSILEHYPGLISPHSKELLTNFVHLISQQRSKIGGTGTLKVNPSGKMARQKWRLKVLQMLQKFLKVIQNAKDDCTHSQRSGTVLTVQIPRDYRTPQHVSFLRANGAFNGRQPPFKMRSDKTTGTTDFLSDPAAISDVAHTLVPLLLQCWGEVTPVAQGTKAPGVSLGWMAAETLQCVMSILQTVWDLLQGVCEEIGDTSALTQMQTAYLRKLEQNFLPGFPYTIHQPPPGQKKGKSAASSSSWNDHTAAYHDLNLAVCNLLLTVVGENRNRFWVDKVMVFVGDILSNYEGSAKDQRVLMTVVRKIITDAHQDADHFVDIVEELYEYYIKAHPLSQKKLIGLKSYAELCLDRTRPHLTNQPPMLSEYLHSLGKLVADARFSSFETSQEALNILLLAARRGYPEAIGCIESHLCDWLDGKKGLILSLSSDLQRRLLECLYHVGEVTPSILQSLTKCCCNASIDAKYPISLLANRFLDYTVYTSRAPPAVHLEFITFLLTVAMGHSLEELANLKEEMISECQSSPLVDLTSIDGSLPRLSVCEESHSTTLHRCIDINETICKVYQRFPHQDAVISAVQSRIDAVCRTCSHLPTQVVYSILYHAQTLHDMRKIPSPFACPEDRLIRLCVVTLYQTVANNKLDHEREAETWVTTLWQLVVDVLVAGGGNMVGKLLQLVADIVPALKGEEALQQLGTVITRLVQISQLKNCWRELRQELKALVDRIENHQLLPGSTRWMAELKYEVSLLPEVSTSSQ